MTVDFEGEMDKMCNLSQGLVDFGIEQGIETGVEKKTLFSCAGDDRGGETCR